MPTVNVSLSNELLHIVQSKVESGLYGDESEVIRDAIRRMDAQEHLLDALQLEQLRQTLQLGISQARAGHYADYSLTSLLDELNAPTAQ